MKSIFDEHSFKASKLVTKSYSTSFGLAVKMLSPSIQLDIHSIYGFVRYADEIVDSFHGYDKEYLLAKFETDLKEALNHGVSLNPILNSFQFTVTKYGIGYDLIDAFLSSMRMDLDKMEYHSEEEYKKYIYGSADAVGLMCLKVFVDGDKEKYNALKEDAMHLGSAFQKVNFLRDLKDDAELLNRKYFPNMDLMNLNKATKEEIIKEIEEDFRKAFNGIKRLPPNAKFGVYTAYLYYKRLLSKLSNVPSHEIMERRIRVSNPLKFALMFRAFVNLKLNLL